jgi:hypothetical protein
MVTKILERKLIPRIAPPFPKKGSLFTGLKELLVVDQWPVEDTTEQS